MNVMVFRAYHRGKLRQVALSLEQLLRRCPGAPSPGWEMQSAVEDLATALGVVSDWDPSGSSAGRAKVRWRCPHCGGIEHHFDFDRADSNPVLTSCEREPGRMCLVSWRHEGPAWEGPQSDSDHA